MMPTRPESARVSHPRRLGWAFVVICLVLGGGVWWRWSARSGQVDAAGAPASSQAAWRGSPAGAGARTERIGDGVGLAQGPSANAQGTHVSVVNLEQRERLARREMWAERLERAKETLESYVASTRYPPQSRSIRDHPDQVVLAEPERTRPLSREHTDVQLRLKQDRVFVVGDEVVLFSVACEDAHRAPRPCEVLSATAREADHMPGAGGMPAVPVAFTDDGAAGDALAGDGVFTGRFHPSKQGFPLYSGTLRVDVQVRSGRAEGTAFLDILYTPTPPAVLTGKVREVVEDGSLSLYLGIEVRKAGRYVVAGRLDDESGEPFAHVSFNEELKEGAREVKLSVFGKLVLDDAPTFPLQLRDVEGFLLKESGDPDRELMATKRGYLHTTQVYPSSVFSRSEWQGEQRLRYIDEYQRQVDEAQRQYDSTFAEPDEKRP
ncbi:choice-of-anchor X domain-containing protein [Myxococcus fulvus]|uniref:choice-of-anchor X domain-containing protein n=1 Tax=Myxococcus fulvus TaxID=33 RepID=UPI003B98FCFA